MLKRTFVRRSENGKGLSDFDGSYADAGYADVNELEKIDSHGIKVIVPSAKQAEKVERSVPFDKTHFKYDKANDRYICAEGKILGYSHTEAQKRKNIQGRRFGLSHM